MEKTSELKQKLPSLFQIGDSVQVQFPGHGNIDTATVTKVTFSRNEVFYDVEVPYFVYAGEHRETHYTRIPRLRGWHLRVPDQQTVTN